MKNILYKMLYLVVFISITACDSDETPPAEQFSEETPVVEQVSEEAVPTEETPSVEEIADETTPVEEIPEETPPAEEIPEETPPIEEIPEEEEEEEEEASLNCTDLGELTIPASSMAFNEVENNADACDAISQSTLSSGSIASATLADDDEDWFLLEVATSAKKLRISTNNCEETELDTTIEIYDSTLSLLGNADDFYITAPSLCSSLTTEFAPGHYAIRVYHSDVDSTAGNYTLSVDQLFPRVDSESEPNNSIATANTYHRQWISQISSLADVDYVEFTVENNNSVIVAEVTDFYSEECEDLNLELQLAILNDAGTQIAWNGDRNPKNFCPKTVSQPLSAGTYYIKVSEEDDGGSFYINQASYGLLIEEVIDAKLIKETESNDTIGGNGTDKGSALRSGEFIVADLTASDVDYFKVDAPAMPNNATIFNYFNISYGDYNCGGISPDSELALFDNTPVIISDNADQNGLCPEAGSSNSGGTHHIRAQADQAAATNVLGPYYLFFDTEYNGSYSHFTSDTYMQIPDKTSGANGALEDSIVLPACYAQAITVDVDIEHGFPEDLTLWLTSPNNDTAKLKQGDLVSFESELFIETFGITHDTADTMTFNYPFETPAGAWTLRIEDQASGFDGYLYQWQINVLCATD